MNRGEAPLIYVDVDVDLGVLFCREGAGSIVVWMNGIGGVLFLFFFSLSSLLRFYLWRGEGYG